MTRPSAVAPTAAEQQRIDALEQAAAQGAPGIIPLLELLADPSWVVRREAVRALGTLGPVAVAALCEVLRSRRDSEARLAAAVDSLVTGATDPLEALITLAQDPRPEVVADAAQVLGRRRSPRAVPVLAKLVGHVDDNVSVAAIEALGRIGGPQAIDALIAAAQSGNFFRVFPAIDVLGRSGDPRAIPPLVGLVANPMYQLEVTRSLGRTGESAAVAPLAALLSHPTEAVARTAAMALADLNARHLKRYGNQDAPQALLAKAGVEASAVARLARSLGAATPDEQLAIAPLLGAIGGEEAAAGLRPLLDAPGALGHAAAAALKRSGRDSDQQLRAALHEGGSARRQVLLPLITRATAQAEMIECLGDPDPLVRALACDALARVGAVGAVPALFTLLADSNRRVIQAVCGAIQSLGSADTKTLALQHAQSPTPAVRRRALQILSYFGFAEALPLFLGALGDEDVPTREIVLVGLSLLEAPEALEALLTAATVAHDKTRAAAMRALGQCAQADPRIELALTAALDDGAAWVRYYAAQALGRVGLETSAPRIERLLSDEAGQVRLAAIEALSHFKSQPAREALRRAALGADPDMQRAALIGLGQSKSPDSTPVFLEAARSGDAATRLVALSALTDCAPVHALAPLISAVVDDPDENVRAAALGSLAVLATPEATSALIDLLRAPAHREHVISLLSLAAPGRVNGLSTALRSADDELAPLLASALARLHTPEADEALFEAMRSPSVPARKAAASSLASLQTPEALGALAHAAVSDTDAHVRQICHVLVSVSP